MSLNKQLTLLLAGVLVVAFTGAAVIGLVTTRQFLERQLSVQAAEAATSLGLTLSGDFGEGDTVSATRRLDAQFDSGYFLSISLQNAQGAVVHQREAALRVEGVPAWFIRWLPLTVPDAIASVDAGWQPAGQVTVRAHPGLAYEQLWNGALRQLGWFTMAGVVGIVALLLGLRAILHPLRSVVEQARAIAERRFGVRTESSRTPELNDVATAMNQLSGRVQTMLETQANDAFELQRKANEDALTGLANRRFFTAALESALADEEATGRGALCMAHVNDFAAYNESVGFVEGDALLRRFGAAVASAVQGFDGALVARLAGPEFIAFVPNVDDERAEMLSDALRTSVARLMLGNRPGWNAGVSCFKRTPDEPLAAKKLLSSADAALREAQRRGSGVVFVLSDVEATLWADAAPGVADAGATRWRSLLERSLREQRFVLHAQKVLPSIDAGALARSALQMEVFARLRLEQRDGTQTLLSAGMFMSYVHHHGLHAALDRQTIELAIRHLSRGTSRIPLAVNVNIRSIADERFAGWLVERLRASGCGPGLMLEVTERVIADELDSLQALMAACRPLGLRFGIDNVGRSVSALGWIETLRPHYMKVDGSIQRSLADSADSQFLVRTLADIAHGLEMEIYAEGVETLVIWNKVRSLRFDGGQGIGLHAPAALGS